MIKNPIKHLLESAQDWIESKVSNERQETHLRQSAIWAKSITWTLVGSTAFGLTWLAIAKTDEIVIARGKIEPLSGVIKIQMPVGGITKKIMVKEGQKVKKGDVLIKLDDEVSLARLIASQENLKINQEIMIGLEPLVNEGAISKTQYLQQKSKISDLRRQVVESQVVMKYQTIKSPINGLVFDLKPRGVGFVAKSSEPVMKIVPSDQFVAKIEIDSRSIGFVSVGKAVDISIDSYPASDFGVIGGKVSKIGSDALPPEPMMNKGYRFPATVKLNNQSLLINNGKKLPLTAGMSLTANIKLRKVSYLQLLLDTFSQKADSLRTL